MVLSAEDYAKAIVLVRDGRSQRYVVQLLNFNPSIIQRVLQG